MARFSSRLAECLPGKLRSESCPITTAPPVDSLKRLTSKDLIDFHAVHYRPNNSILAVVGDVTMKEFLTKVEKVFGDWQKGDVPVTNIELRIRVNDCQKIHVFSMLREHNYCLVNWTEGHSFF